MSWNDPDMYLVKSITKLFRVFQNEKISWNCHKWRKIFECFQTVFHSCSGNVGTSFFPKKLFSLGSGLEALYKVVQKRDDFLPSPVAPHEEDPGSLASSVGPILTSPTEDTSSRDWTCRGNLHYLPLGFPQPSLSSLVCQQEGQALGWSERYSIYQISRAVTTLLWSLLAGGTPRCLPMNQPIQALFCSSSAILPMTDRGHRQGHILLLSTTHGHCPPQMLMDWEASWATSLPIVPGKCFRLSFSFSWNWLHTIHFPDIMLSFVAVSNTVWRML